MTFYLGQVLHTDKGTYQVLVTANNSVLLSEFKTGKTKWWLIDGENLVREKEILTERLAPVIPEV